MAKNSSNYHIFFDFSCFWGKMTQKMTNFGLWPKSPQRFVPLAVPVAQCRIWVQKRKLTQKIDYERIIIESLFKKVRSKSVIYLWILLCLEKCSHFRVIFHNSIYLWPVYVSQIVSISSLPISRWSTQLSKYEYYDVV